MKTRSIARGIVGSVAALLGVMAAGCSAETGEPEAAEIGSTAEALVISGTFDSLTDPASNPQVAIPLEGAAGCRLREGSDDYLLTFGGVNAAGSAVVNDMYLLNPGGAASQNPSAQWIKHATFTTARAFATPFQLSSDLSSCYFVGGADKNGAALSAPPTIKVSLSRVSGVLTLTVDNTGGAMNANKSQVALFPCGSGKIIAIGGSSTSLTQPISGAGTAATATIEIYDPSTKTWSVGKNGATQVDINPRVEFGAIKDPASDTYLVGQGHNGSGFENSFDFVKVTSSCSATAVTVTNDPMTLTTPVRGNVLIPKTPSASPPVYFTAAGSDGTNLPTATRQFEVNWSAPSLANQAAGPAMPTSGHRKPALVVADDQTNSKTRYVLIGGGNASLATSLATVDEYVVGTGWSTQVSLSTARLHAAAAHLPSRTVASGGNTFESIFVTTGINSGTRTATTERIVMNP